jgi:hypothetical protein
LTPANASAPPEWVDLVEGLGFLGLGLALAALLWCEGCAPRDADLYGAGGAPAVQVPVGGETSSGGRGGAATAAPAPNVVLSPIVAYRCAPDVTVVHLDGTEERISSCVVQSCQVVGQGLGWTCEDGSRVCHVAGGPVTDITIMAWCQGR